MVLSQSCYNILLIESVIHGRFIFIILRRLICSCCYFKTCDWLFQKSTTKLIFALCSFAWRGALSMETGRDHHTSLWLGPAGWGEGTRVHRLWEGKRARDGWGGRGSSKRGGETWSQPKGGVKSVFGVCFCGANIDVCHNMNNFLCLCEQVPRDFTESELFDISGKNKTKQNTKLHQYSKQMGNRRAWDLN